MKKNTIEVIQNEPEIIYSGRPSFWMLLPEVAHVIGWLVFFSVLVALGVPWQIAVLGLGCAVLWLAHFAVILLCFHFHIDAQRITITQGILTRSTQSLELFRVQDVVSVRRWWMRLVGIGEIRILTSDAAMPSARISGLPVDVDALRAELNRRAIALRNLHGYREVNMARV